MGNPAYEKLLEKPAQQLAAIVESSDDAILTKDLRGVILSWNRGAERLFGYKAEEVIGKPVTVLIPPDREAEEPRILRLIGSGEKVDHLETVRCRKDGTLVDISLSVTPIRDERGRVVGATKVARDITERRHNRQQRDLLVQTDQRLAAIVESSEDAILSKDLNGIIRSWNSGAERLFGYKADEVVGQPVYILIPEDRHDEEPGILARLARGERIEHYETVRRRKDGTLIDISLSVSPVRDASGRVIGAAKIARDITERRRVQQQQNLLLREMNHRIKNLFALASGLVTLSARSAATPQELASSVRKRLGALARAHELTLTDLSEPDARLDRATTLSDLIPTIVSPFLDGETSHRERMTLSGPPVGIGSNAVTHVALLISELATNAAKYGALSVPNGRLAITWSVAVDRLRMKWEERGGPPVRETDAEGFGSVLARVTVTEQLGGEMKRVWNPEGLIVEILIQLDRLRS